FFAMSPDGRSVAMSTENLLVRSLETGAVRTLSMSDIARAPFWSPDSRRLAYFAGSKLQVVPASGGIPQTLCENVSGGAAGTWNHAGVLLFTSNGSLMRVDAAGGPCTEWIKAEAGTDSQAPMFLPDGNHFLFTGGRQSQPGIYVASLTDPSATRLLPE